MTRAELVAILSDLVGRDAITLDDARLTLARFDSGELVDLPMTGAPTLTGDRWAIALALLLLLLNRTGIGKLNQRERNRARRLLQTQFDTRVAQLATEVAAGGSVLGWQRQMQKSVRDYTLQMAVAGAGTLPSATVQATVETKLNGQWNYLAAFAVTLLVGRIAGNMLSEAAISARSVLYGGSGWGAFWRGAEPEGFGQIVHYEAKDDNGTCGPCSEAAHNGPYVAGGNYPRPGEICLGRGRCRCTLRFEYSPEIYSRLTGRRAA